MNRQSKRFNPTKWSERLIPFLLALLAIGLLVTVAIVILSLIGLTPGF